MSVSENASEPMKRGRKTKKKQENPNTTKKKKTKKLKKKKKQTRKNMGQVMKTIGESHHRSRDAVT